MRVLLFILVSLFFSQSFLSDQLRYKRVRDARDQTDTYLKNEFKKKGLAYPPEVILLRAFKAEDELELWVRDKEDEAFKLFKTYDIVKKSGELGPKKIQGDLQVPEGLYYIDRYNPSSSFHLSLGINYPNNADKRSNPSANWGGDIFIHGSDVTIGCLPMTDEIIKEIYWLAVQAKNINSAHTNVQIFPYRMNAVNNLYYEFLYYNNPELKGFWDSLQPIYDSFEEDHKLSRIVISKDGKYSLE